MLAGILESSFLQISINIAYDHIADWQFLRNFSLLSILDNMIIEYALYIKYSVNNLRWRNYCLCYNYVSIFF